MDIRVILMMSWFCLGVSGGSCPALYLRYSKDHTFCRPPNSACKIFQNKVSQSDIEVILSEHNKLRSKVATGQETDYSMPGASNMLQMVWDDELAKVAQKHADQCIFDHDCNNCRRVKNYDVGQNLMGGEAGSKNAKADWAGAVNGWYNEVKDFDQNQLPGFIDGHGPPQTGHFTQVVWGDSWRVGCGHSVNKMNGQLSELYTCNYGPGGNMEEAPVYKEGDACSKCPINSCCGDSCSGGKSYPGLCRINGNNAPQYERPEGYNFYCSFNNEPDCARTVTGAQKWEVSKTLSETYIGIVLNGGESSTLSFTTPFKLPSGSMCFTIYYRTGPQVDGQRSAGDGMVNFKLPSSPGFKYSPKLRSNGDLSLTKFNIGLGWNSETKFEVIFSVPGGQPAQYLEFSNVSVRKGPC